MIRQQMETVDDFANVPDFADEGQEAEYWAMHELGDTILEQMASLPEDILSAPRACMKPVVERLNEEEKREGL